MAVVMLMAVVTGAIIIWLVLPGIGLYDADDFYIDA